MLRLLFNSVRFFNLMKNRTPLYSSVSAVSRTARRWVTLIKSLVQHVGNMNLNKHLLKYNFLN